jgi:NAD(P)-dependent dehydrogenase (short-subunit alcohol dehydrogenase family)
LVREEGAEAHVVIADVPRASDAERIVADAARVFGWLVALVNNAAVQIAKSVPETSEEETNTFK